MASAPSREQETLKVVIRVRPPILKEVQYESSVVVQGQSAISIISENKEATCSFDRVFDEVTQQEEVFETVKPLLVDVLAGVNSCVFAYGQTSSGKSYTMIGPNGGQDMMHMDRDLWGILPRASEFLMGYLHDRAAEGMLTYEVKASFLQIYNENLYDLLRDSGPAIEDRKLPFERDSEELKIREVPKPRSKLSSSKDAPKEVYVSGLSEFRVETSDDILKIVAIGTSNRMTRSTDFNLTSSRSHALLTLTFEIESQNESGQTVITRSKLNLIDLAGSEKLPIMSTIADNNPKHVKELSAINKSLSSLGNVIAALASATRTHIPYRDSKLTRILQDSLSGNTRTVLLACVAPTVLHTIETMSTLQFAERAKNIKLSVRANTLVDDKVTLAKAQAEIGRLKALLSHAMKQLEEKGGGGPGISAPEFERLAVENEKLKRENQTLKRLAKTNSLGSFDDMSVRSIGEESDRSKPRSSRNSLVGQGSNLKQAGFLSGAGRFSGQANEFFGAAKLSKHKSPSKGPKSAGPKSAGPKSRDWDSDTDVGRPKKFESPSAFLRKQQQQEYGGRGKPQSKVHAKLFKAINDRQVAELNYMIEEANKKMLEQQQQMYMAMQDPQQQQLLMVQFQQQQQQQQQQHQQMLMQAHPMQAQAQALPTMGMPIGPGPGGGARMPVPLGFLDQPNSMGMGPTAVAPVPSYPSAQLSNLYGGGYGGKPDWSKNAGMSGFGHHLNDNDSNFQESEFAPLGVDEGKHIPIISISAQDHAQQRQLLNQLQQQQQQLAQQQQQAQQQAQQQQTQQQLAQHQQQQWRPPSEFSAPLSNRSNAQPVVSSNGGPKPLVKPAPAAPEPLEPPSNRIFLKKGGVKDNGMGAPPAVGAGAGQGAGPGGLPKVDTRANVSNSTSLFASAVNMYASKASSKLTEMVRNIASSSNESNNEAGTPAPANLHGDDDDVGRSIEMFSFRLNIWERIEILDFEPSKRLHKCQYPNGSVQWLDLTKKPVRSIE